jgi:hypothetical protein
MHPKTFDIKEFESFGKADEAGYTVPLTKPETQELSGMNRKQRRAWLSQQRKEDKK